MHALNRADKGFLAINAKKTRNNEERVRFLPDFAFCATITRDLRSKNWPINALYTGYPQREFCDFLRSLVRQVDQKVLETRHF